MSRSFPGLAGRKTLLRSFDAADLTSTYIGWLNDREVMRYSNQRFRNHTRESCEEFFKSFDGTDNLFLSIRDADNDQAIGTMTVYRAVNHRTCDVGIMIGERRYWGGGYGQEAWDMMTSWLLTVGGVRKLTAGCLAPNHGMVRLMERSGMSCEAIRKAQELVDGKPEDIVLYARFAD